MAVGGNCDPSRPGFNSLLLLRDAIERARNIERAVERIVDARRGVTWEFIFAGVGVRGGADRACVVEAGASTDDMAFLDYPGDRVKPLLPDETFLERHRSTDVLRGAMVRWDDYQVPQEYLEFNGDLCERFRRSVPDTAFEPIGRINRTPTDRIAPAGTTSLRPGGCRAKCCWQPTTSSFQKCVSARCIRGLSGCSALASTTVNGATTS